MLRVNVARFQRHKLLVDLAGALCRDRAATGAAAALEDVMHTALWLGIMTGTGRAMEASCGECWLSSGRNPAPLPVKAFALSWPKAPCILCHGASRRFPD